MPRHGLESVTSDDIRDRRGGGTFDASFACEKRPAIGTRGMVVTNHPLASAAGAEMLAAGGNAIDGAVAALFTLSVVEPMMVGIFGGGICHLRLTDLVEPAIRHARRGFPITGYLSGCIAECAADLAADTEIARPLLPGAKPLAAGDRLVSANYAETPATIATEGVTALHGGSLGRHAVDYLASRGGMNGIRFNEDGSMTGAAFWRADGTAIGIGGGPARPNTRFWPEAPRA